MVIQCYLVIFSVAFRISLKPLHADYSIFSKTFCISRSALSVAVAVSTSVAASGLDRMSPALLQTLCACVNSASEVPGKIREVLLAGKWVDIFTALRDFIFVGFCDPESCSSAASIVTNFVFYSPSREAIIRDSKFLGNLSLL